jgi:uncharacterized membrane protein
METAQGKVFHSRQAEVEVQVARLLRIGSALAAVLVAGGIGVLTLGGHEGTGTQLVTAGLVALVLTPVLRVATALLVFLKERDWAFTLISFTVLCAMAVGVLLGRTH